MLEELYDRSIILLVLATGFNALFLYPVLGPVITFVYTVWAYSFLFTPLLDTWFDNEMIQALYTVSFIGTGFTVILAPILGVALIVSSWITQYFGLITHGRAVIIAFYTTIALSVYAILKSFYVKVREEYLDLGLNDEISIVHVADLHIGASLGKSRLQNIVDKIHSINPDYTLITGDVLDGSGWPEKSILEPLEQLSNVYASLGNHDYYFGEKAARYLEANGVTVLRNESRETDDLRLTAVDDIEYPGHDPSEHIIELDQAAQNPSLLLYHRPEEVETFKNSSYDVMVCGHTHNGQLYPNTLLLHLIYDYLYGFYEFGGKYLNVTSGAGTGGPTMRLGTTSEITKLTLK